MGKMISPITVADHLRELLDGFVLDRADDAVRDAVAMPVLVTDTIMSDMASKAGLARRVLAFAAQLEVNTPAPNPGRRR